MESRPGVLVVGSSGVGKRTLLSRLLSVKFEDSLEPSSQTEVHGWMINTKYYTADVSVWISHIRDDYSLPNLPQSHPLVALVMVFDLSELSTLVALQDWVSHTDISNFDILLCIGNKVDRVPHHLAHDEYRRRLLKATDPSLYSDTDEFGISETEGSILLGSEDTSLDIRGTCLDWCCENNIEFIEACASNPDFDECLSVDGDSQGVERLFGALSAHMWPGMILKSGEKIDEPVLAQGEGYLLLPFLLPYMLRVPKTSLPGFLTRVKVISDHFLTTHLVRFHWNLTRCSARKMLHQNSTRVRNPGDDISLPLGFMLIGSYISSFSELSEEESEYELEYEVLSAGSGDPWENNDERWVSASGTHSYADAGGSTSQENIHVENNLVKPNKVVDEELWLSGSRLEPPNDTDRAIVTDEKPLDTEIKKCYEFEDVEQLMSEIGNIRDNLRLIPDFQRREIAANLAMKMASMFGGDSDDEEEPE